MYLSRQSRLRRDGSFRRGPERRISAERMGRSQRFGRAGVARRHRGYRIQRHPWLARGRATLELDFDRLCPGGIRVTGPGSLGRVHTAPPSTSRGRCSPRSMHRHRGLTGSSRQRSLIVLPESENKPTFGGSSRRNPGCVARWARHAG